MKRDKIDKKDFSKKLIIEMKNKGINQTDLAKILHISPQAVNDWIKEKTAPRLDLQKELCELFNASESYFFEKGKYRNTQEHINAIRNNQKKDSEMLMLLFAFWGFQITEQTKDYYILSNRNGADYKISKRDARLIFYDYEQMFKHRLEPIGYKPPWEQ